MRRAVWILLGLLLLGGSTYAPNDDAGSSRPGCEPAGPLNLHARLLSLVDAGHGVRATVEVTLSSGVHASGARIGASRLVGGRARRMQGADTTLGALTPGGVSRRYYTIDLERGQEHHVYFHVRASAKQGELASSFYLRVNLDPSKEPEDLGSLLQFRVLPGDP